MGNSLQLATDLNNDKLSTGANVSPYTSSIPLSKMYGHTSGTLQCVPKQNVIYQSPTPQTTDANYGFAYRLGGYCNKGADWNKQSTCKFDKNTAGWPELNANSSFGTLIPFWQNNAGQGGSCVYIGQDNNPFDDTRLSQRASLVSMLVSLPGGACKVDQAAAGAVGMCPGLQPGERCMLVDAPPGASDDDLAVFASLDTDKNGNPVANPPCKAKVWKRVPPGSPASVPTTGLPALLGLSALLPLLAARRRRRE